MASSFGRYTSGIEASTGGLVQASGQMAAQTADTFAGFGKNLAQGIQAYNENSQKSEAANAKIQMLGQAYAEKIAMYAKDPEIAQSGILDGLMAKAALLQDAPTKGLSQRVMIAHEAETSLAGFGSQLQEWSFLRGREMERNAEEALRKFAGFKSVTQAAFVGDAEFQIDLNLSTQEAQEQALAKLGRIRKSNPNLQGTDEEFLSAWRTAREQALANAKGVAPSVISAGLEAIQAEKNNAKAQADAQKKNDISGLLSSKFMSTDAPAQSGFVDLTKFTKPTEDKSVFLAPVGKTVASLKDYEKTVVSPVEQVYRNENPKKVPTETDARIAEIAAQAKTDIGVLEKKQTELKQKLEQEEKGSYFKQSSPAERTLDNVSELLRKFKLTVKEEFSSINPQTGKAELDKAKVARNVLYAMPAFQVPSLLEKLGAFDNKSKYEKDLIKSQILSSEVASGNAPTKTELELVTKELALAKQRATGANKAIEPEKPRQTVAPVPLQGFQIGTEERQRRITVAERQREVADFVTSRMGAIDPTDPERKRRLPVAGFDKFYKSLVPESEIREFTTDSGVRMIYANGKWEQIKSEKPMTPAEIRKGNIGVFGTQTGDGRLVPSEFIPNSGVYIGGLFKGSDSAVDKFQEELPKLIDARRGVKVLREINDQMGESLSPTAQGIALVEEMNLSAMLRTDIVGVGTVSNYEQQLIKRVTENSVNFFSLESKDRAILIALAERVDRRIKSLSAAHGLTVELRDDRGVSKYQALREQYLKEKGIL